MSDEPFAYYYECCNVIRRNKNGHAFEDRKPIPLYKGKKGEKT